MLKVKNEPLSYVVGDCKLEGTLPLYANNFTWWQPTPVFCYQLILLSSSTIAQVNASESFLEIKI